MAIGQYSLFDPKILCARISVSSHHRTAMMMNQPEIRPEGTHAESSGESEREELPKVNIVG
jgi:hypothetical protein